ncbi:MAG: hypothetical protein HFH86_01225 [Bacilli bacterium]|nr:hypothetical protein [Bacilli bacterium]
MEQQNHCMDINDKLKQIFNNSHITSSLWINNINGKNYLLKFWEENNQKYRALIIEKMAKIAQIPTPHIELISYKDYQGELIEDYRQEHFKYISGETILYEYFLAMKHTTNFQSILPKYLLKDWLTKDEKTELIKRLNNLETIWNAVEFHFRNYQHKNKIVYNILTNLANRFAFDFLTMQRDRHAANWEIEKNRTSATLTPLFDSNRSFYFPSFNLEFHINEHYKLSDIYEELEYFLTYSERIFCAYFYNLYNRFSLTQLSNIINQIEKNINAEIPKDIKIEIMGSYEEHYEKLTEIIKRRDKKK